jgi:hypothetical protein
MYDDVCVCYIISMDILVELPTSVFTQIIFNIIYRAYFLNLESLLIVDNNMSICFSEFYDSLWCDKLFQL